MIDLRKFAAEALGTAILVFVAVGVATLSFGFGFTGESVAAGVVATSLAFGFVLTGLVYAIGPISGCHVNPAVTLAFVVSRRMELRDAFAYWIAQFAGGVAGAVVLWAMFQGSDAYTGGVGLGADGFGASSMIGINSLGAFLAEVVLTFVFVMVVLSATSQLASAGFAGLAIGMSLAVVHLLGIPLTGTSVNPARSLGPALIVQGSALSQLWLFLVAPMVGGVLAALTARFLHPRPVTPKVAPGAVTGSDIPAGSRPQAV